MAGPFLDCPNYGVQFITNRPFFENSLTETQFNLTFGQQKSMTGNSLPALPSDSFLESDASFEFRFVFAVFIHFHLLTYAL